MFKFRRFAPCKWLLALLLVMPGLPFGGTAMAEDLGENLKSGDFLYREIGDSEAEITGYDGTDPEVVIPGTINGRTVTRIGDWAFREKGFTGVTIPDSVKEIGNEAFAANELAGVVLGNGIERIGNYAFAWNKLTGVTIPGSVKTISEGAFADNELESVTLEDGIRTIGPEAFAWNALTEVTIPGSVTEIQRAAFYENALASLTLRNGLQRIGKGAFAWNQLASVTIPGSVETIGEQAFVENDLTSVVLEDGIKAIQTAAFANNKMESVRIPGSVETIGEEAFVYNALTEVVLENGIREIDYAAFAGNRIEEVTIPGSVQTIGESAFAENELVRVHLEDGVQSIGPGAFAWNRIEEVAIPGSVETIGESAFFGNELRHLTLMDGVGEIGDYAFQKNVLTNVVIPGSVTVIGELAFFENSITNLTLGYGVENIGAGAFMENGLTSLTIPGSVKAIGNSAFFDNDIVQLSLEHGVEEIGPFAFERNALSTVTIPGSVKVIGAFAFRENQLIEVILEDGIETIESGAFVVNQIAEVTIPDSVKEIGPYAFAFNNITRATLPNQLSVITEGVFAYNLLSDVTIPESVHEVQPLAFALNHLTGLIVPEGVDRIGELAFLNDSLAFVVFENPSVKFYTMPLDEIPDYFFFPCSTDVCTAIIGYRESQAETLAWFEGLPFIDIDSVNIQPNGNSKWKQYHLIDVAVTTPNASQAYYLWSKSGDIPDLDLKAGEWQPLDSGLVFTPDETGKWCLFVRAEVKAADNPELGLVNDLVWVRRSKPFHVDVDPPEITLRGPSTLRIPVGTAYEEPGYAAVDNVDGDITENVVVSGDTVDVSRPGEYTVQYAVTDSAGNESEPVQRIVQVYEIAPPPSPPAGIGPIGGGEIPGQGTAEAEPEAAAPPVVQTVAPDEEAVVEYGDVLALTVPAGASEAPVTITVSEVTDVEELVAALGDNRTLASAVLEILKDKPGVFNEPVTIAIRFDPAKVGEGQTVSIFYYDEERKEWVDIGGTVEGEWVTATVDHFTKFAAIAVDVPEKTAPAFTDIAGHWGESAIREAAARKLVTGYPDGTFRPNSEVTRAEFLVMLARALGWEVKTPTKELPFADADRIGPWAAGAVEAALDRGVVGGYPDGAFRPDAPVTRAEMAAMIARALGFADMAGGPDALTPFADDADIPAWAKGAVESLRQLGLLQGRADGRFAPDAPLTRAEAAAVLLRWLEIRG